MCTSVGWPNRLAFEGIQQGGFLAADIGAGTDPHFQVEGQAAAADIATEIAGGAGDAERLAQRRHCLWIFRAYIDVAVAGADAEPGNGHAFDQQEGVALHEHAVGEGAGVTLVGVADDVLLRRLGAAHRAPFDPGGESRAATTAQAGPRRPESNTAVAVCSPPRAMARARPSKPPWAR